MEDRIVVVTGAPGRLGERLVAAYTDAGATVAGVDQRAADIPVPVGATVDTYGADGGAGQQPGYSAAKEGGVRLVESLTEEYADDEITAHAIAPSMLLFGEEEPGTAGVAAEHIVDLALYPSNPVHGQALNGGVIRAYGTMQ